MKVPKAVNALAFRDGTVLRAHDGTRYVMSHVNEPRGSCTLRRVHPKVRGKAARREDRRRRRELRQAQERAR